MKVRLPARPDQPAHARDGGAVRTLLRSRNRRESQAERQGDTAPAGDFESPERVHRGPGHEFGKVAVYDPWQEEVGEPDRTVPQPLPPVCDEADATEEADEDRAEEADGVDPQRLMDRATEGPPEPVPQQAALQVQLGRSLTHIEVYRGPRAQESLDLLGAKAAARGPQIVLPPQPDLRTVAHEVVHVLQAGAGAVAPAAGIAAERSPAEHEAERLAGQVAEAVRGSAAAPLSDAVWRPGGGFDLPIRGTLGAGVVALRRSTPVAPAPASGSTPADAFAAARARPASPVAEKPVAEKPVQPARGPVAEPAAPRKEAGAAVAPAPAVGAVPVLEPAPPPEPGVTAEDVAAREAALAEAEAALVEAKDVDEAVDAFAAAPPTLKARRYDALGPDVDRLAREEDASFQEELPDFHAKLSAEVGPEEVPPVKAPEPREVRLEEQPPPPAPDVKLPATPDLGAFTANAKIAEIFQRLFGIGPGDRAAQIGDSLKDVRTTDPDLSTSPGAAPTVPLAGETDPARIGAQSEEGVGQARRSRDEAQQAVINGPGPERVKPLSLDQAYTVGALDPPVVKPPAPVDGTQAYLALNLPPEVQTAFDLTLQEPMQASLAGARAEAGKATTERDRKRQEEVERAEGEVRKQTEDSDRKQRGEVLGARQRIQTERQGTLEAQAKAVSDLETKAKDESASTQAKIDKRVKDDEKTIRDRYAKAESEAREKERAAEKEAEEKKAKAEREAENQSWWDRAVSFVKDAFSKLADAISWVFDKVRKAINAVLDAVKAVAKGLIDAVATFIKGAIKVFGEVLKAGVNLLLSEAFPELAKKLNDKIDGAVAAAEKAVDAVADGLKAGIDFLVEGLRGVLNKVLDVLEAGVQLAVGLVEAAITGDWGALARKALEAVLKVVGVSPDEFYAFIGRAEETFQIILDDPLAFLGHCVDSVVGGVQKFADNFVTHLQAGVIGWLTGTLGSAGITPPERFDLWGVLDLARQIIGLTKERLREKAVKLIGEQNFEIIEFVWGYVETLLEKGWSGLFEKIQEDLSGLVDTVFDGIKSFLQESIIWAAITQLATLFNPVGAIVRLVLTAWRLYEFLRDQLQRIIAVLKSVVDAIGDIARGVIEPAALKVEGVLAGLLPLAIDLLARILGLGGIGEKVREIIQGIQQRIEDAVAMLLEKVKKLFGKDRKGMENAAEMTPEERHGKLIDDVFALIDAADEGEDPQAKVANKKKIADQFIDESAGLLGKKLKFRVALNNEAALEQSDSLVWWAEIAPNTVHKQTIEQLIRNVAVLRGQIMKDPWWAKVIPDLQLYEKGKNTNAEILKHLPTVWDALHDPSLIAYIIEKLLKKAQSLTSTEIANWTATIRAEALRQHREYGQSLDEPQVPDLNRLAVATLIFSRKEAEITVAVFNDDEFFKRNVARDSRFYDVGVLPEHGATTHLIQELVVDEALAKANLSMRSHEFRRMFNRAQLTAGVADQESLWAHLYDAPDYELNDPAKWFINAPEILAHILREIPTKWSGPVPAQIRVLADLQ